jgi:hypothetical protein
VAGGLARWALSSGVHARVRTFGLALGFGAALVTLNVALGKHYPLERWLFWLYLTYFLCGVGFLLVWLSAGYAALARFHRGLPFGECVYLSVPVGVLIYFWCTFIAGRLSLFGPAFGVILPVALGAVGARPLFSSLLREWPRLRRAFRRRAPLSPLELVVVAFGCLGLLIVYAGVVTPENAAYDARWYHLPIAEQYAAAGGIERSPEGWFLITLPHLASLIYLWPWLFPGLRLFDQVEIAAHLEFALFLWTLAGVPLLLRYLVPRVRARTSWAAFFLFPSLYVYDSCLSIAADHVAAFWAIPIFLALGKAWPALEPRACALLGALVAGAALTKYQAINIAFVALAALVLRAAWLAVRDFVRPEGPARNHNWLWGTLVTALVTLVLTSAHWLKNWIWYGDPVYPLLFNYVTERPWNVDGPDNYRGQTARELWRPAGTLLEQLKETTRALFTFWSEPHDWFQFHHDWPVFGFLFTLSLFLLPFLRAPRRVWALFLAGNAALFVWYFTSHQDRYLQILTPWLVGEVAAVIVLAWRAGVVGRAGMTLLCLLQAVWGFGTFFIPSHSYTGSSAKAAYDLFGSGYDRDRRKKRFDVFTAWVRAGRSVPANGKILVHHEDVHLGLGRQSVSDSAMWQGLINYGRMPSQRAIHAQLQSLGVTHVLWIEGDTLARMSLASDLRFSALIVNYLDGERVFDHLHLARLPSSPPKNPDRERVLYLACAGYSPGIYELTTLTVPGLNPPASIAYPAPRIPLTNATPDVLAHAVEDVDFVVLNPHCPEHFTLRQLGDRGFVQRYHRGPDELWVRQLHKPRESSVR